MLVSMKLPQASVLAIVVMMTSQLLAEQASPPAATQPSATAMVNRAVGDAIRVLGDRSVPEAQKREKIRDVAQQTLDFDTLARLSLGRYWRDLSESQRRDFTEAFKQHLLNTCSEMTTGYSDQQIAALGEHAEADGDRTVQTSVSGKDDNGNNAEYAKVDFRTRQRKGEWKVIDISTSGVSMLAAFKVQFESLMAIGGYDRVMKLLHDKNASVVATK